MSTRRRQLRRIYDPVLTVDATRTSVLRLVYLLVANRPVKYGKEQSRIMYIGTTEKGIRRIARSASVKVTEALEYKGIKRLDAHVVWTSNTKNVGGKRSWRILERALLIAFKEKYGEPPKLITVGKGFRERDEFQYFRRKAVDRVIGGYE